MLGFYFSIILVIGILIMFIFKYSSKCNQLVDQLKKSEDNYRELEGKFEAVISSLENRVNEEVANNRQKDHTLIQHSKLAAMGEMITSIGHLWQQPLNSLSLLIQDVKEAVQFGEINDQYIDQFTQESMNQIKHMSRTIKDFRKFYQPNNEKTSFSVSDSIEEALMIFSPSLKEHHIHVNFEFRGQHLAFGFPNEYSQVVLNILMNARDAFIMNEVVNRRVDIMIRSLDSSIIVDFIDNAGGIEEVLLPKLFEPYFTTKHHGTGIGLYMTRMIIENMNGLVKVENTEEGAKLSLIVPKAEAEIDV
ncbi:HAMP domain-containing sensor histidine kinase [Neobacillus niacini]|uniref:sensor histidine kinase n=1 Tax=Neobacillus niacini TaxID=86668 RepID=UPI002FFF9302